MVLGEPEEANILGLSVCIIFYLLFELLSCCGGEVQEPAPKCRTQDSESNYLKTHLKQKSPKLTKCIKNSNSQTVWGSAAQNNNRLQEDRAEWDTGAHTWKGTQTVHKKLVKTWHFLQILTQNPWPESGYVFRSYHVIYSLLWHRKVWQSSLTP